MTNAPKIELKNIKHTAWASEETHCYQATLYVDGAKWGNVGNDGHGGCDHFYGVDGKTYADIKILNDRIKATMPKLVFNDGSLEQDLELICGELVNEWLRDREFNKAMRSKLLFTKPETAGVWQVPVKKTHTLEAMLSAYKTKFPAFTFLADLPVEQAKTLYFA